MRIRNSLRIPSLKSVDLSNLYLIVFSFLFVGGCFAGRSFSEYCMESYRIEITEYLMDFCETARTKVPQATFFRTLGSFFLYPLAAFFAGFSPFGVVLIPILFLCFGFGIMFTVQCFVCVFSRAGILPALALFSVRLIVILICFLPLAVEALPQALRIARVSIRSSGRCETLCRGRRILVVSMLCLVGLIVGVCCEKILTPMLFRLALIKIT